jgi:hypothetical protein
MGGTMDLFKTEKAQITATIDRATDDILSTIIGSLITDSPVWTGKFVEGMKIEKKAKSYPRTKKAGMKPFPPQVSSEIKSPIINKLAREMSVMMKKHRKASINNSAKHALFVEYLGWPEYNTPAPHPFAKAIAIGRASKARLAKNAKKYVFGGGFSVVFYKHPWKK